MAGRKTFDPNWCIRPGVHLAEIMEHDRLTPASTAAITGLSVEDVDGVLDGSIEIDERIAAGLGKFASAGMWLNLERTYREGLAAGKIDASDL